MRTRSLLILVLLASASVVQAEGGSNTRSVTEPTSGLTLRLPSNWQQHSGSTGAYANPQTPQYNFFISAMERPLEYIERAGSLRALSRVLVDGNPTARESVELVSSQDTVLWRYRTSTTETGEAKDDRHWLLVRRGETSVHLATFTLSVLADHADPLETDEHVRLLDKEIAGATFGSTSGSR